MGDLDESSPIVEQTLAALKPLVTKPKLTAKHLARPPFKYLYEMIMGLSAGKGFPPADIFADIDKDVEALSADKTAKAAFLKKVMDAVSSRLGEPVDCDPHKILAGKMADKTNAFLQQLARAVTAAPGGEKAAAGEKPKKKKKAAAAAEEGAAEEAAAPAKKTTKKKKAAAAEDGASKKELAPPTEETGEGAPVEKKKRKKKAAAADEGAAAEAEAAAAADAEAAPAAAPAPSAEEQNAASMLDQFQDQPKADAAGGAASLAPAPPAASPAPAPAPSPKPQAAAPAETAPSATATAAAAAANAAAAAAPKPSVGVTGVQAKKKAGDEKPLLAAKPPPRIQGAMRAVDTNKGDAPKVTLVGEKDQDDEEEEVIITEAPVDTGLADDIATGNLAETGGLVGEIKQSMDQLKGTDGAGPTKKILTAAAARKQKMEKDIAKLRESIQSICQCAHPVSKALDYYQEDLDSMDKELEMWRNEAASFRRALEDEENATKTSLQPYLAQLQQQDQNIREQEDKIMTIKASIAENARKIEQMLSLVVKG